MPYDDVFRIGSFGKAYLDVAAWYGYQAESLGAKNICMPFVGLGRIASAVCREDTTMNVCDFQRISTGLIEGIFAAKAYESNVDKPRFLKGKAYETRFAKYIDVRSAGFIDWVAAKGTPLDVVCIGMAIPGMTLRGWMTEWKQSFETFYQKFLDIRDQAGKYIPRPGKWNYWEADFFQLLQEDVMTSPKEPFDLLIIDPPRLSGGGDLYSSAWSRLNRVLLGEVSIEQWNMRNYFHNLSEMMNVPSSHLLFSWTEGRHPNPTTDQIEQFLKEQGDILTREDWRIHGKDIHAWSVRRNQCQ